MTAFADQLKLLSEQQLTQVHRRLNAWLRLNHERIACECDPRTGKTCTKSGWIRCNARLGARGQKYRELVAAALKK